MKKIIRGLSLVLALIFVINPFQINATTNNRAVDSTLAEGMARFYNEYGQELWLLCNFEEVPLTETESVSVLEMLEELPDSTISAFNAGYDAISTNDDRFYTATAYFNCHSYAWYSQNTETNDYWMNDPRQYYDLGLYYEVSTPSVGDIICYFDDNGTSANISDDTNLHSGIIVQVYGVYLADGLAGSYEVESKWGSAGLYRHNGYECPYTDYALTYNTQMPEENRAEYVKFYRRSGHTHNFNAYNDFGNEYYHQCICSCGMIIHNRHNWTLHYGKPVAQRGVNYIPEYYCAQCNAFSLYPY